MDAGRYWRVVVATAFVGATWETRLRVTGLEAKVTAAAEGPDVDGGTVVTGRDGNGGLLKVTGDGAMMGDIGKADGGANGLIVSPPLWRRGGANSEDEGGAEDATPSRAVAVVERRDETFVEEAVAAAAAAVGEEGSFGRCAVLTGTRPWLRGGDTEVVMC